MYYFPQTLTYTEVAVVRGLIVLLSKRRNTPVDVVPDTVVAVGVFTDEKYCWLEAVPVGEIGVTDTSSTVVIPAGAKLTVQFPDAVVAVGPDQKHFGLATAPDEV